MASVSTMPPMLRLNRSLQSGLFVMTAAWQVVYTTSSPIAYLFGGAEIDLSVMGAADTINIRVRKILSGVTTWVIHDQTPYVGVQPVGHPTVHIAAIANTFGIEIAMQQTAGVLRTVMCEFYDAKRIGLF